MFPIFFECTTDGFTQEYSGLLEPKFHRNNPVNLSMVISYNPHERVKNPNIKDKEANNTVYMIQFLGQGYTITWGYVDKDERDADLARVNEFCERMRQNLMKVVEALIMGHRQVAESIIRKTNRQETTVPQAIELMRAHATVLRDDAAKLPAGKLKADQTVALADIAGTIGMLFECFMIMEQQLKRNGIA